MALARYAHRYLEATVKTFDSTSHTGGIARRNGHAASFAGAKQARPVAPDSIRGAAALVAALVAGLLVAAGEASAAGFFVQEQSVRGVGSAHAGQAAAADSAGTIFFNPAGMTELERAELEVGAHLLIPRTDMDDRGTAAATPSSLGAAVGVGGGDGGNPFDPTLVPNLFVAVPMPDGRTWLGLGASAPFGLFLEYDDDWFGRYDSTKTQLTTIDIAPTAAYRLNRFLSIGGGIDVQYADAELKNAIPNPLAPGGPTAATDGKFRVEGDDWSVGFNVGVLIKPTTATRVGLHYRSALSHDLEGDAQISGLGGPLAALNGTVPMSSELELPDIATLAIAHELSERVTLLGHFLWFGWDRFDEIRIKFANGSPDAVTPENYEDSWAVAVGVEYEPMENWRVRGGFQFDDTPSVTGFRDTRVPDEDRYWVALGASYTLSQRFEFDLAYAHVFLDDAEIDVTRTFFGGTPLASTVDVDATSASDVDIVSVRALVRF